MIVQAPVADFDLAVVGGGVNGAGIARDAAGRGLKVLLVEQNDLASGTSSANALHPASVGRAAAAVDDQAWSGGLRLARPP
jgi:glycine/D-amino acid oxidase-like deaminating enzyme